MCRKLNYVKIEEVAYINPKAFPLANDLPVTFLPMSQVSDSGKIIKREQRLCHEVRNGYTPFIEKDILVAKITPCFENFKGCFAEKLINGCGFGSTEFHVIRAKADVLPEYIHLITRTAHFRQTGVLHMTGSAGQKRVPRSFINSYKFLLPPKAQQQKIANLLSTWDDAIEKTEMLITAKQKQFEWLLSGYFLSHTVNKNLTAKELQNLVTIKKGEQLNRSELENSGKYPAWNGGVTPSGYTNDWNMPKNTVTISEGGNSCGFVNYCQQKFWCGGHCYALIDIKDYLNTEFLYFCLKAHEKNIMRLRVGSGLPNIQKKDIDKFIIKYPNLEKQKFITQTLNIAQNEINILKQQAEQYRTQKRGLLQKLLTGKRRL